MLRVGLDIGHSATKVSVNDTSKGEIQNIIFPTLVIQAFKLFDERTALAAKVDTVRYDGKDWFVGETAAKQGKLAAFTGQDRNWVFSETHDILVISALDRVRRSVGMSLAGSIITVGLPAAFYATQKTAARSRIQGVITQAYGEEMAANLSVRVQPQPYGPLQIIALDPDGAPARRNIDEESWGVVEIGHFTTDFILVNAGQIIEHASGSSEGLRGIYERMTPEFLAREYSASPDDLTGALLSGVIRHYGKQIDVSPIINEAADAVSREIIAETQRLFGPYASKLDGVLVAGGGAPLIAPRLHRVYPHTKLLENPRYAVAEGFRRHSCYVGHLN